MIAKGCDNLDLIVFMCLWRRKNGSEFSVVSKDLKAQEWQYSKHKHYQLHDLNWHVYLSKPHQLRFHCLQPHYHHQGVASQIGKSLGINVKLLTGGGTKKKMLNPPMSRVDLLVASFGALSKLTTVGKTTHYFISVL